MAALYLLKEQSTVPMMSMLFKNETHLVVIDGGLTADAEYLFEYIKKFGGTVDAWFFTHLHKDHTDAFLTILKNHSGEIKIKNVYASFPSDAFLKAYSPDEGLPKKKELERAIADAEIPFHEVSKGQFFSFGDMTFRVIRTPDETITEAPLNNSSVVYRVETERTALLILGDLEVPGGKQLLADTPRELLHSEYVQISHHGHDSVERAVYEAISPTYCLWPTTAELWHCRDGAECNIGPVIPSVIRGWMEEMKVKRHYVTKDGTQEITL